MRALGVSAILVICITHNVDVVIGQEGIEAYDRSISLVQSDLRLSASLRNRKLLDLRYERDQILLREAAKVADLSRLISVAQEIEREWAGIKSDYTAALYGRAALELMRGFRSEPRAFELALHLGNSTLDRLTGTDSLTFQDYALSYLTGGLAANPMEQGAVAAHLDKARVLDAHLTLIQGATIYSQVPLEDQLKPLAEHGERNTLNDMPLLAGKELERVVKLIENGYKYDDLKEQWTFFVQTNSITGTTRLELYPQQISRIVKARFGSGVDDLLIVRRSLQTRITDPILRDKLMAAIYGRENPFLALPADTVGAGGGPSLEALTRKSPASGHGAMATGGSRGESPSASVPAPSETPQSTSPRSLPYLPLAGVLAAGLVLWWFISRSRPG